MRLRLRGVISKRISPASRRRICRTNMTTKGLTTCRPTCAAALTSYPACDPGQSGRLVLGTWQGIFLFEHRRDTPEREIALHLIGE